MMTAALLLALGQVAQVPALPLIPPVVKPQAAADPGVEVARVKLTMKPDALTSDVHKASFLKYYPKSVVLSHERPEGVVKEPVYIGTPWYAMMTVGSGPKAPLIVVLDETDDQARIYLDANRDGDLTNDPTLSWTQVKKSDGKTSLQGVFRVPAYWGAGEPAEYAINAYRMQGGDRLFLYRAAARAGTVTLDGKSYSIVLADNSSNALYSNAGITPRKGIGVWLLVDLDGDGTYKPTNAGREVNDTLGAFPIGDAWYTAEFPEDGSELILRRVEAPPTKPSKPRNPLVKVGQPAPDFAMLLPDGTKLRLSGSAGKIRLVDFWATWCGPCIGSMPKVESVYQQVKTQGVEVTALCVMDERESFDSWIPKNQDKYHFTFAFDPSSLAHEAGGVADAYGIYAIPTTLLIDKDGTILAVLTGASDESLLKMQSVLAEKGVTISVEGLLHEKTPAKEKESSQE